MNLLGFLSTLLLLLFGEPRLLSRLRLVLVLWSFLREADLSADLLVLSLEELPSSLTEPSEDSSPSEELK